MVARGSHKQKLVNGSKIDVEFVACENEVAKDIQNGKVYKHAVNVSKSEKL